MRGRDEAGQVSAFVVVMALALVFMAGLVVDGGFILAAELQADNEAQGAARAGAAALSEEAFRNSSGRLDIDVAKATSAARAYLAQTGHDGTVRVSGNTVEVEVRFSEPLRILGVGGLADRQVHGVGRARNVGGIAVEEP